jgi:GH25 family lysozyme M1 (1,4-beta-N-acetylmuramidase)
MNANRFVAVGIGSLLSLVACVNDIGDSVANAGNIDEDELAFTRQCKPAATVKGIDVSYYQETIDWAQVASDGVQFAFIRVSDGVGFLDPKFARNWEKARENGVIRGAYQFFRAHQDPIAQADLLLANMGPLQAGDLPPVIDVEATNGQSAATIRAKVQTWIDHVEALTGVKPIVYTGPYFWRDNVGAMDLSDHPLWIAHYGTECPYVAPPWTQWTFHQFTDSGSVRGVPGNVDRNVFNGTLEQLRALTVGGAPAQPVGQCGVLAATESLDVGDAKSSCNGKVSLTLKSDGNLVLAQNTSGGARTLWSSATNGQDARTLIVEEDGNVVLYGPDSALWATGTYDNAGAALRVQDDGNLVVKNASGQNVWTSGTTLLTCPRIKANPGAGSTLNVRRAASTSQAPIGTLVHAEVVDRIQTVTGQSVGGNTTWYKIQRGALVGFVSAKYANCAE